MPNSVVVLDLGHGYIKAGLVTGRDGRELTNLHALFELTDARYEDTLRRAGGKQGPNYARINGIPHVFGEQALSAGVIHRRERADRYRREYYGVLAAHTIARLVGRSGEVTLFAAHPPGDAIYTDELAEAVRGEWAVELDGRTIVLNIGDIYTFDEPLGGLSNVTFTDDGHMYERPSGIGRQLVIDIGYTTTDIAASDEHGEIDYLVTDTITLGIGDIVRRFAEEFKAANKELTRTARDLPEDRIREAIKTNVFTGGGQIVQCAEIVADVTYTLLNELEAIYNGRTIGGPLGWDSIILTGGGAALLFPHLLPLLKHNHVLKAADRDDEIHLANMRGGRKLWKAMKLQGAL